MGIAISYIRYSGAEQYPNIEYRIYKKMTKKARNFENRGYLKKPIFEYTEYPNT